MKKKKTARQLISLLLSLSMSLTPLAASVQAAEVSALPDTESSSLSESPDFCGGASVPELTDSPVQGDFSSDGCAEESSEPVPDSSEPQQRDAETSPAQPSEDGSSESSPEDSPAPQEPAQTEEESAAQRMKVCSADQLADFLSDQWRDDYFQEAVVDTRNNRVTVDGQRSSVEEAFGIEADEEAILESTKSAEAYFEDTAFETERLSGGKLSVTAPWQTCRIVVTASSLPENYGAQTVVEYPAYHQFVLQFADEASTKQAFESLSGRYQCYVDRICTAEDTIQETDDQTWGYDYMDFSAPREASVFSDSGSIQVAVIDSGCWASNSFFEGRSFSAASKSFPDNNGAFVDALSTSHGTHVAGILHTCCPANAELMILRVFSQSSGETSLLLVDTAIKYALENGADLINISLGIQSAVTSTEYFLDQALNAARRKDVPVVCSAGNLSVDTACNYPSCSEDTIAVSAINRSGQFAYTFSETPNPDALGTLKIGSSYGQSIDFSAPGVGVVSASRTGTASKNGTSMAAPHITAALAWLLLEDSSSNWSQLYERLKELCVDLGEPGKDQLYGWGCPNLRTLGTAAQAHVHQWTSTVTPPTCDSEGYTTYSCTGCTEIRIRDYVGPTHSFDENGACTQCGQTLNNRCGDQLTWSYNSSTQTLTITGSGTVTSASWESLYPRQFIRGLSFSGVTGVADGLFSGYPALESVNLGEKLTTLGQNTFSSCTSLKKLTLPASLTDIGDGSFCSCTALSKISSMSSSFTVMDDALLLDEAKSRLIACAGAWSGGTLTLPTQLTRIAPKACRGVSGLTKLILPPALVSLGAESFAECENLSEIYARSSDSTLGADAFDGVTATVYVSEGCTGWEAGVRSTLGGALTWSSYPGNLGDESLWTMKVNTLGAPNYTGAARRPGVTLTHGDTVVRNYTQKDQTPPNYRDYFSYSYANNVEPGVNTASVTITGKGIYYGTRTQSFSILLTAPTMLPSQNGLGGVSVHWQRTPLDGEAEYPSLTYQVLRREDGQTNWTVLGTCSEPSYTDAAAQSGHRYDYSVRCLNQNLQAASSFDDGYTAGILRLAAPTLTGVALQDNGSINISWNSVDGAVSHRVLRKDNSTGAWQTLSEGVTGTSWTDTAPVVGGSNWYTVQAVGPDGAESAWTSGLGANCLPVPTLTGLSCQPTGVLLSWDAVNAAGSYRAYCKEDAGAWHRVGQTSSTSLLLTTSDGHTPFQSGKTYSFTLRCVSPDGTTDESAWDAVGRSLVYLYPSLSSAVNEGSGVRLRWTASASPVNHRVLCKTGSGAWKTVATTTSNSVLVKTSNGKTPLKTGTSYRFVVFCVGADGTTPIGAYDSTGKSVVYVCGSSLSSLKNKKKQKLVAKWKRISGVNGYQLQIALNRNFTSGKKTYNLKGYRSVSKTLKKLPKKTCWVRVRCRKSVGGKTYWSGWSPVKSVSIRK